MAIIDNTPKEKAKPVAKPTKVIPTKSETNLDFLEEEEKEEEQEQEKPKQVASKEVKEKAKDYIKPSSSGSNIEQKENSREKIITLRAVFGKTQGALKIRPVAERGTGRIITGQPYMSEDEKKRSVHPIDANTVQTIMDGHIYDLNDSVQKAHWEWVKVHPYIAANFEAAQSLPQAMFYVEDLEADMDKKSSKIDQIYQAITLVRECSVTKRAEVMRLLGQDSRFFKPKQVSSYLEDICMNNPGKILSVFGDKFYELRLLLFNLMDKKIVVFKNGVYKYEDVNLGISEDQAIIFLSSSENRQLVQLLARALNG